MPLPITLDESPGQRVVFALFGVAMVLWGWFGEHSTGFGRTNIEYDLEGVLAVANSVALTLFGASGIAMGATGKVHLLSAVVGALGMCLWLAVLVIAASGAG